MPSLETESERISISQRTLDELREIQKYAGEDSVEQTLNFLINSYKKRARGAKKWE